MIDGCEAYDEAGVCITAHRFLSLINLFTQTENGNGRGRM